MNNQGTSKPKENSQNGFINTVKDWLTPQAIKEVKKNQAKVKQSEGVKEIKK